MPNDGLYKEVSPIFYDSKLQKSAAKHWIEKMWRHMSET